MGKPMSIAVCDEDGVLKAFRRMDGAALLSDLVSVTKSTLPGTLITILGCCHDLEICEACR